MGINYKYDAFISYRHVSPDKEIAEKLQKKLENYKPPKALRNLKKSGGWRIFRDETELPTSSNLSNDIQAALEESQYLIVICSKTTKDSRWCLEEIEYFKKLHNGNNANIITLVADGNPEDVFPSSLCNELIPVTDEYGNATYQSHIIEPLAANVAGESLKESLKKLNTEFLRIAAPILGCGYDNLYNREHKKKIRRIFAIGGIVITLLLLFGIYNSAMLWEINNQKVALAAANENLQKKTEELNQSNLNLQQSNKELAEKTKEAEDNLAEANKQKQVAEDNLNEAEKQRKIAEQNLAEANRQKLIAENNLAEANHQKQIAENNLTEANRQKTIADANAEEAKSQKAIAEENMLVAQENEAKANEQTRLAQIENSENLSRLSQTLWDNGDGIEAVKTVLSALPNGKDNRPVVPTAEKVLANEMNVFDRESFRSCLSIKHDKAISKIGYAGNGTSIVTQTSDGIYFWDSQTGRLKKSYTDSDGIESYSKLVFENKQIIKSSYLLKNTGATFMMDDDGIHGYAKSKENEILISSDDVFVFGSKSIIKLDGKTGNIIWDKNVDIDVPSDEKYFSTDFSLVENYVVAHCYSTTDDNSFIMLYNASDGELAAKYTISEYKFGSFDNDNWIYFADKKAYFFDILFGFTQGRLISFDVVGDNLVNPTVLYEHYDNENNADASLEEYQVIDETLYILFEYDCGTMLDKSTAVMQAYDLSSGTLIWSREIDNIFGSTWFGRYAKIGKIAANNANNCCEVIFAATGKKLILFNEEDGSSLREYDYNDSAINAYYSLDGMIYLITETGKELAFGIRNNDSFDMSKATSNFVTHQFNIEAPMIGYCNNNYAVCLRNSNTVYVFKDVINENFKEIHNAGEFSSIKSVKLNASGNFAVITAYSKEENVANIIYVYDIEKDIKHELLRSSEYIDYVEFIDENKICILNSKKLSFFDIVSREEIISFNEDESLYISENNLATIYDGVAHKDGNSLTFYNESGITKWEPKQPSKYSFKEWENGYIKNFYISPSDKILATVKYYEEQNGGIRLELYNIDTSDSITLNTNILNEKDKIAIVGCSWADDTVSACFNNGQVETFNIYSGECISSVKIDIVPCAVTSIGKNIITILANDYSLHKVNILDGSVMDSISLSSNDITDSYNKKMRYVADRNILIVESTKDTWIIDLESFKVRYELEYFSDYNPVKNIVALDIYNYAGICPLYTTDELINIGNNYLGIKE